MSESKLPSLQSQGFCGICPRLWAALLSCLSRHSEGLTWLSNTTMELGKWQQESIIGWVWLNIWNVEEYGNDC